MEKDDDLSKYAADDDPIKPIDTGGNPAPPPPEKKPAPPSGPVDDSLHGDFIETDAHRREVELEEERRKAREQEVKDALQDDTNFIKKGEYLDLIEKVPILKRLMIGVGWQKRLVEGETLDIDISMFMLNKNDQTRVDEDFVFYNNTKACDGAVHHLGDSRSGAGDGDDENIFIDLNGLPFDIMKIVFVFSLYDPEYKGHNFGMIRKMYFRIFNKDDGKEIIRYHLDEDDKQTGNAIIIGTMIREGPRWIFEATSQVFNGGLAEVATEYGIIVKELQSSGEEGFANQEEADMF